MNLPAGLQGQSFPIDDGAEDVLAVRMDKEWAPQASSCRNSELFR